MPNHKTNSSNLVSRIKLRKSFAAFFAIGMALSGCSDDGSEVPRGTIGHVSGFYGGVAGDEPHAVLAGRDVLTAGGTAADAAVSMIFTLAVTSPANVSLAGGGVCVVHDANVGVTEALDFLGGPGSGRGGDRPTAVPALPRGMVALHARYGSLDWRGLVAGAEKMARLGHRMSRASARELALVARPLFADQEARKIFMNKKGQPYGEGEKFSQLELAVMLGKIRASGGGAFYEGVTAKSLVNAVQQAGGTLTLEDLRSYRPEWRETVRVPVGDDIAHFLPPPAGGGLLAAQAAAMAWGDDRYADADAGERAHLQTEVLKRAYAERRLYLKPDWNSREPADQLVSEDHIESVMANYNPDQATSVLKIGAAPEARENGAGTGVVVVDRSGMAVVCELGLNNMFGTGRVAPGTGMILAAAPSGGTRNPLNLSPMVVANPHTFNFRYAAAGGGGIAHAAAMLQVSSAVLQGDQTVGEAIASPRLSPGPKLERTYVEEADSQAIQQALRNRGHAVKTIKNLGRVNAMYCELGLPDSRQGGERICEVEQDPRWHGLAVVAN